MQPIRYPDIPLFAGVEAQNMEPLLLCLRGFRRAYEKGSYILLDQEHVKNVGVVLFGSVHMLKEDIWGNQTMLSYMGPGELFGETFAIQRDTKSYVSFLAAADTEVLFLSLDAVIHPCAKQCPFHLRLTQNLFDLIGGKNVRLLERIEVSSKGTLREKILSFLSLQAQHQGSKYITIPLSRAEMASYLQSNRSALSRELSAMREEGLLDFDKNVFVIK